jgi:hypothetical protein
MKSLPLAALALSAAAAQAFTVDLIVGPSRPSTEPVAGAYDTNTLAGIALAWKVSPRAALGVSLQHRDIEWDGGQTAADSREALTASVDATFELGTGKGGLRPFFGLSAGNTWLETAAGDQSALTFSAQAGIKLEVSETADVILGMRRIHVLNVDFDNVVGTADEDIRAWEPFIGLSLKF